MAGDCPRPALIVVSGPPGSGKTTLAHEIARAAGCPAVCRDEIKEGMAHASPGFTPGEGDRRAGSSRGGAAARSAGADQVTGKTAMGC